MYTRILSDQGWEPFARVWVRCVSHLYHKEPNNQGFSKRLVESDEEVGRTTGAIACRERLGSMLRYNYRKAA